MVKIALSQATFFCNKINIDKYYLFFNKFIMTQGEIKEALEHVVTLLFVFVALKKIY